LGKVVDPKHEDKQKTDSIKLNIQAVFFIAFLLGKMVLIKQTRLFNFTMQFRFVQLLEKYP